MIEGLHIRLLGEFSLVYGDQPVTTVNTARLQALLAYLVLHRDAPQPRYHLAFQFWPDSDETQARTNLRHLVHLLRQTLPHADDFLDAEGVMLQWRADAPWTLDVAEFENAVARRALREAVDVYRGDLLPACYDDWMMPERERLQQEYVEALERLVQQLEGAQDYGAAIEYARRLLRHDPVREATYRQLMSLCALSGDRTGVARAYDTCVTVLQRELGLEPDVETRAAYERCLKLPASAHRGAEFAPTPRAGARSHNLPYALTRFIGREHEMREVRQLLAEHRLVMLTGAGGVGKSRLAIQVAHQVLPLYPHGVWLVELAPLADPTLVPQTVMAIFDLPQDVRRAPQTVLTDYFCEKTALLVLDNCEHVLGVCAQLAEYLLTHCPGLRVLGTSRQAMGIDGEAALRVPPLSLPPVDTSTREALTHSEAAQLFLDHAAMALPGLALADANAPAVAQICHRLDGIALAIELAASRVGLLKVEQIAARLDDAFRLLTGGSRTALPHHQTLRATIDWSYNLLSDAQRILLRRLAVFAGGWTLEAAEAICAGNGLEAGNVLDLLAQLVNKSLVMAGYEQSGEPRYYLLETVRQYAREKLSESGEAESIRHQHQVYFVALAERAAPELHCAEQRAWFDRLEGEHDNLRAALGWSLEGGEARAEVGLRMAGNLWWFWFMRGYEHEGGKWLERTLTASQASADLVTRAKTLGKSGWLNSGGAHAEEGLALGRTLGPAGRESMALALWVMGARAFYEADYDRAKSLEEESLRLFREIGHRWGICETLTWLGMVLIAQGDHRQATPLLEESLALARQARDINDIGFALWQLGEVTIARGDYEQATTLLEESLAQFRKIGMYAGIHWLLGPLGNANLHKGDYQQAASHYKECLTLSWERGSKRRVAESLERLAHVAAMRKQLEQAARLLGAAEALRESSGAPLHPYQRAEYEDCLEVLRPQLNEVALATLWAEGRAMTVDEAVAYALELPD